MQDQSSTENQITDKSVESKENVSSDQMKFVFSILTSIIIFFVIYLNFPDLTYENKLLKFSYDLIKILISFISMILLLNIYVKINFIKTDKAKIAYIHPILDFVKRYNKLAIFILLLISLYRISDIVMGVMANIFYVEKGYTLKDIAFFSKFLGLFATISGGILGGIFAMNFGALRALLIGSIIAALTNILFAILAISEIDTFLLASVIIADNIASGFAGAAFIVFLSSITSIKFTATQYALFSSLMLFIPKLIAGYSGLLVNVVGYPFFFIISAVIGLPVIFLILFINNIQISKK